MVDSCWGAVGVWSAWVVGADGFVPGTGDEEVGFGGVG